MQRSGNFYNVYFLKSSGLGLRVKKYFFLAVFGWLYVPWIRESVDPHIFMDPDPENRNLMNPTDPDPTHCQGGWVYLQPGEAG